MYKGTLLACAALAVAVGLLAACGGPSQTPAVEEPATAVPTAADEAQPEPTEPPAAGDGEVLLQERCTVCHGLGQVTQAQKTREAWEQTVTRMVGRGAELDEEEQAILIAYLAETYGP